MAGVCPKRMARCGHDRRSHELPRQHRPAGPPRGRGPDDPDLHACGRLPGVDQADRHQPAGEGAAAPRRPGRHARVPRVVRRLAPRRRGSSTTTTTSSAPTTATSPTTRRCGRSTASSTRSSRSAVALGLDRENFFLYGQSWGGILAIEYALAHQEHLKGLVVSNMMSSIPAYNEYAEQVLMPPMDQDALAEIKRLEAAGETDDPSYEALLMRAPLRAPRLPAAARGVAGAGGAGLRAHQPADLRLRCRGRASSVPAASWWTGTAAATCTGSASPPW